MTTVVRLRASSSARRITIWFAIACMAAVALGVVYVHDRTGDGGLFPTGAPPKVVYHDRDYSRGADVASVGAGFARTGQTMGGGVIYAPSGSRTPTVIDVVVAHRSVEYGLVGGP